MGCVQPTTIPAAEARRRQAGYLWTAGHPSTTGATGTLAQTRGMEQDSGRKLSFADLSSTNTSGDELVYVKSGNCQFFPALPLARPTEFAVQYLRQRLPRSAMAGTCQPPKYWILVARAV
jgi:hypothetical protein